MAQGKTMKKQTVTNKQRVIPEEQVKAAEEFIAEVKEKVSFGETKIKMLANRINSHAPHGVYEKGREYIVDGKLAKDFLDEGVADKC